MEKRIWKVRMKKLYPEATNHVAVGKVLEETEIYVKMKCRTYHFRKPTISTHIFISDTKTRIFPWNTIAYITELPHDFAWEKAEAELIENADIILKAQEKKEKVGIKGGPHWLEG